MSSQIFLTIFTVSLLFETCYSAGFLRFDFTSDSECLLHVDGPSYTGTIRLLAYETRSIELYSQGALTEMSVQLQLLHHFSGQPLSELSSQVFSLDNNDKWSSRVIDTDNVILSIRTLFHCENGYFGALCERKSRQVSDTSA
uniref:Galectin n=1 Tax=Caenorhabditis japonica TaxID=281687 RepID=A0A8R1EK72_CAEJA